MPPYGYEETIFKAWGMSCAFLEERTANKGREMSIDEVTEALLNGEDTSTSIYWESQQ